MLGSIARFVPPLVVLAGLSNAVLPDGRPNANFKPMAPLPLVAFTGSEGPVISRNGTELLAYNTTYYFDQLIDHNNPSLGTFKQRFWHTYENYEQGGPVIISTPGEGNANGYWKYLTNSTLNGQLAQQQNGTSIVIEHRFYGLSNPYPDLSVESLKVHTLQQAVDDLVYFANNIHLPMPNGDQLGPDQAPWVLMGGSYSGALTSWTMVNKPGVFWAGYASSAVVEAIVDFWEYFEPIRTNMPANCSADVSAVIEYIDKTFSGTNQTAINQIKDTFGMSKVQHLDDIAGALRNNLWDWQSLQPTSGPNTEFFKFCDALEIKNGQSAPASGWGLDHALTAWGSYWKSYYYTKLCGNVDPEVCLGTYDSTLPYWTNTTIDNANRSWNWIVCNEVGYYQEGAPAGHPTVVSRLIQPPYDLRQCQQFFPQAFAQIPSVATAESWIAATNKKFQGWDVKLNRIFFANGKRDPWKDATVSADSHPVESTTQQPIGLSDGFHCTDLGTASGQIDATVRAVQTQALAAFKGWLAEWKPREETGYTSRKVASEAPRPAGRSGPARGDDGQTKHISSFSKGSGTI